MTAQQKKRIYRLGIVNPGDFLNETSGGTTGFITSILPYLNSHEVTIFGVSISGGMPWNTINLRKNILFVPVAILKSGSKIPMRLKCLLSYFRNRKRIIKTGVDILYIHSPECCLPFLFFNRDIPVIFHQHGSANPVVRSKYAYARNRLFKGIFENILKIIYKRADWIVAIDRLCNAKAVQHRAGKKTSLLMNAVDTEKFKPNIAARIERRNRLGIDENCYAIFFVGRLEKVKGPEHLLECIPFLKAQGLNCHIFFAGDGTYRRNLVDYVIRKHLDSEVTFIGQVSHDSLPLYYNMADVLVLPSEMEGVPMVILEALSCGTPVVASNVGGIPDFVINNINGTVLYDITAKSLAAAIINICTANLNRQAISETVQKFSSSIFVSTLLDIIANIIKKHKKKQKYYPLRY